jgi:tRNA pseudouridine65 synthase
MLTEGAAAVAAPLPIVYRDAVIVVVHKPSGLLVHRSNIDRHETRFAVQILRDQIGHHVHPVHRLDKGTSGLLVFTLDKPTAVALSGQFERAEVGKRYVAIVRGVPEESGAIDHALSRQRDATEWTPANADSPPQPAQTRFRRLDSIELPVRVDRYPSSRYALLEVEPLTGRRHQIRRHLKHLAHPVIGDATYGKGRHNRLFAELFGCRRLLLACVGLRFRHPMSGMPLELAALPAEDFVDVARQAGFKTSILDSSVNRPWS